ncbi:MAG: hypothetical protein JSV96_13185 [Candidatus Aminicenantes bacterium]|nr:MAG: hypothetical protein JSV96_13185 [Candidatus Aminicenantes bacterium]
MKKSIALFLVFSILAISANLYAKERRGADLVITKKDSQQLRGELIAVKENSLLLRDSESGADVSVDIRDVKVIKIVGKSKILKGIGYGLLIGGGGGALIGGTICNQIVGECKFSDAAIFFGLIGGAAGLLVGAIWGESRGKDKTIQIEGKSDSEIKEALERLRRKARVPDFQ